MVMRAEVKYELEELRKALSEGDCRMGRRFEAR